MRWDGCRTSVWCTAAFSIHDVQTIKASKKKNLSNISHHHFRELGYLDYIRLDIILNASEHIILGLNTLNLLREFCITVPMGKNDFRNNVVNHSLSISNDLYVLIISSFKPSSVDCQWEIKHSFVFPDIDK